jgi:hypothetical protein
MSVVRFNNWAGLLSAVILTAACLLAPGAPANADDATSAAHVTAKRSTASLNLGNGSLPGASAPARSSGGFANGFVYSPGALPNAAIRGRLNVGKSGVYVPYYGGTDPSRPGIQGGVAGIGYGFHGWDISVYDAGAGVAPAGPGVDAPKSNPSLSFSIRF